MYCHPGALRGPSPGLPTLTKCWGCHQQIAKTDTSPKLAVLKDYVLNNKEIAWVPVARCRTLSTLHTGLILQQD